MCIDPITGATIGLSVLQAGLGMMEQSNQLTEQSRSLNRQAQRAYAENAYDYVEQNRAARDEGYTAEMTKRKAMGTARVLGSTLGIRGATATDLVRDEAGIGNFNVGLARDRMRSAGTAYHMGTAGTYSTARDQAATLEASAPSAFEQILGLSTAGLSGYMLGSQISGAGSDGGIGFGKGKPSGRPFQSNVGHW